MNWYYIDASHREGPLNETEWQEQVRSGKIRPETLVWHDGMGDLWLPFGQLPPEPDAEEPDEPLAEEEDELHEEPGEDPLLYAQRVAGQDYTVQIKRCVTAAWECFRSNFWPLVAATFCSMALLFVVKMMPLLEMLLGGVILGGLFVLCLRLMRGLPTGMSDLLEGFKPPLLKPLVLQTLVNSLVWMVCSIPVVMAMHAMGLGDLTPEKIMAAFSAGTMDSLIDPQTSVVLLLVMMTCSLPAVYFSFCWIFSIPLIVDKGMPFWPAMSRRKVLQHPLRVSLLVMVAGILSVLGGFFFFVGGFLTLPLYFLITLYLYETIFNAPTQPAAKEEPFKAPADPE